MRKTLILIIAEKGSDNKFYGHLSKSLFSHKRQVQENTARWQSYDFREKSLKIKYNFKWRYILYLQNLLMKNIVHMGDNINNNPMLQNKSHHVCKSENRNM